MKKAALPLLLISLLCCSSCKPKKDGGEGETVEMGKWDIGDIRIRDPFILPDTITGKYYMYAQKGNRIIREDWDTLSGVEVYSSTDLRTWSGPKDVFTFPEGFWADYQVWAPEVHPYRDKFYLFVTLSSHDTLDDVSPVGWHLPKRGTQILVSDDPEGPFKPFDNRPHTPLEWSSLDGTLWVQDGIPYMVFCHEWTQIRNGSMELVRLANDLSAPVSEPVTLFHAGDADWVRSVREGGMVTDGCFLYRTVGGQLIMIWSSFGDHAYAIGTVVSENGRVEGPWVQGDLLFRENGGHGMIFKTFDGELCLVFHQPNRSPEERAQLYRLIEEDNKLILGDKYFQD
jgi:GH43 family beta-xylosidase